MHTSHEVNFSTDVEGLEEAKSPDVIRLRDGETHEIEIKPVRKRIDDSEVTIEATNLGDVDATLHWHGLRLENRFDGVPEETQAPIPHGGTFTYRLRFPDPGFYWYHPHIREDFAQEMGLYAGIIVEPEDPGYWPPVDRQLAITLDDILIEDGQIAPFDRSGPTFTAMGRFRQRDADQRRDRVPRRGQGRGGRPHAFGRHGKHPDLQLRHPWRADEVGRWRQRSRRARGVR